MNKSVNTKRQLWLAAFTACTLGACVKPGGNAALGGSGGSTAPGSGGTGNTGTGGASGGMAGMGNVMVLPPLTGGAAGIGDSGVTGGASGASGAGTAGAVTKMSCTAPPVNYPYAPGYSIPANAVSQAQNTVNSMTTTQRADQMRGTAAGPSTGRNYSDIFRTIDSGGVKGFKFRDGPRGVNLLAENPSGAQGYSTTFPVPVARGASFDLDLEYHIGQAMGDEMVASQHNILLAPTINILRHPFWGRSQETYGEDAFHLGRVGSAVTVGIQEYVPACAKHYAANNIEVNRASLNANMDEQTLQETYARHYQMVVQDAGISCVMAAYNSVNNVKSTQNPHLLTDLLRTQFGFQGFVLSDWWAMAGGQNATTDQQKATATAAIGAGLDLEMPWSFNYSQLETQVTAGALTQAAVNAAALRVVREKFRFNVASASGLKAATTTLNGSNSIANNDAHIEIARQAALEGMVLLKNDNNTLPITQAGRTVTTVAVIGKQVPWSITGSGTTLSGTVDFARDIRIGDLGSSRVQPDPAKTVGPLAGITAAANGISVITSADASAANTADFIIVVAGLTPQDEGEEYTGAADRTSFSLDAKTNGGQNALITSVAQIATQRNKPMAVVLEGGAVIDTSAWAAQVPAIVMAWYPGQAGGTALGQLLFGGNYNFSGKLPVTWATSGWPSFNDGTSTTMSYYVGYRWFDKQAVTPTYFFGHGLSYTKFQYTAVQVPCSDVTKTAEVPVQVSLYNTGAVAGTETVFVFVQYLAAAPAGVQRSVKELKAFSRITIPPANAGSGESGGRQITIPLRVSDLQVFDPTSNRMQVVTGPVRVLVGPSADPATLMPSDANDMSTTFTVN